MKILEKFKDKKILILGLGREGLSSYLFLRKHFPEQILTLADQQDLRDLSEEISSHLERDKKVNLQLGKKYLENLGSYDYIFVTAGIKDEVVDSSKIEAKVYTNSGLFFELFRGKIIGVTGTKGKSTTSSLIYHILKEGGLDVIFAGNIGKPALSLLEKAKEKTIFVLELSSYQLMRLKKSPHIAVIQNIAPEHLDYHGSFANYVDAKSNIVKYQSSQDYVFYNAASTTASRVANISIGKKKSFNSESADIDESLLNLAKIPLKGRFNLQNILPGFLIARMFDIPDNKIISAIQSFKTLEHRLEFVGSVSGADYYNDSLSTIPESAIAAISAFPGKQKILILGGYDRGLDFTKLASTILSDKIKGIILFPTTGEKIWKAVLEQNKDQNPLPKHIFSKDMAQAVKQAAEWAKKGDAVLLSPASPSFSVFKNYEERGNKFKKEVLKLKNEN